jgi:hypothetical protein
MDWRDPQQTIAASTSVLWTGRGLNGLTPTARRSCASLISSGRFLAGMRSGMRRSIFMRRSSCHCWFERRRQIVPKVLCSTYNAHGADMELGGLKAAVCSFADASALGVAVIFQDFSLRRVSTLRRTYRAVLTGILLIRQTGLR